MQGETNRSTRVIAVVALLSMVALAAVAVTSGRWVLTATPLGFLFGFFLQKGDLCGASAMSEVLIMRDATKLLGLWICIVVSMLAFAAGHALGLVTLNPKPMFWALYLVGGLLFGAGTVLAGGCVSGCLFKAAAGNLNSIAALVAMPAGIALVEYGPLKPLFLQLKTRVVPGPGGKALDYAAVTGAPFWALALLIAGATLAALLWRRRRAGERPASTGPRTPLVRRLLMRSWRPWQAGLAIGLLALPMWISSAASGRNYPVGVTHGVLQLQVLVTESQIVHVHRKPAAPAPAAPATAAPATSAPATPAPVAPQGKKVVWWLVLVVVGLLLGSFTSARLSGQARLLPKPPEQTLVALLGGFLVGVGAALGTGCVIGNIMSGWALMSLGLLIFGAATLIGNWIVTYFYLMGGSLGRG